jgi:hypothetical protein
VRNGLNAPIDSREDSSSEFLIRHEKLDLRISLWPLRLLLLHEETIPDRVVELKAAFSRDGVARDPVIVDRDSAVVLDGMHRVAALGELRCSYIPGCSVDYMDPSIRVAVWYRVLHGRVIASQLEGALASSGIRLVSCAADMMTITQSSSPTMILASGQCFRLDSEELSACEVLRLTEQRSQELHLNVAFETEQDAIEKLNKRTTDAIVTVPKIDKAAVRAAGLTGRLLPHKLTRHIIPARPLRVNVPLSRLIEDTIPLQEANEQFVASLRARGITHSPSGTVLDGRRYEEETFIFN